MFSLTGKVALVTGASRGIGKAIATQLQSLGATVIGTATSEHGATKISEYLGEGDVKGMGLVLNVTSADSITAMFSAIKDTHGAIDILVNNAGITRDNLFMRMKDDEWQDILDTNLSSVFKVSKAAIRPMMKKRNGRIINIGSINGQAGQYGQVNYAAAKSGIHGFTKALAQEGAGKGITVNALAPGDIDTDMVRSVPPVVLEKIIAKIPVGRLGHADEIARGVLFLVADEGGFVTGSTLSINGGQHMY